MLLEDIDQEIQSYVDRLSAVRAEQCRRELKAFVYEFWEVIEPEQELVWNWHLDSLCDELQKLEAGDHERAIFNVPPGTMKSILCNIMFKPWVWTRNPSARFLSASYSLSLSLDMNVKSRQIIQSPKYRAMFPLVQFSGDQNAKEHFDTTEGGWSLATSVGGVGTGKHPDYVIIDDPLTEVQSRSEVERENVNKWISRTISSRGVVRNVRVLVVMQRFHMDDASGYLLGKGNWEHVEFPMRYIGRVEHPDGRVELPDPRDIRSYKGELLWPELFNEKKVRQLEVDLGPFGAAGQLQQKPVPEGGGLFKRDWFQYVAAPPAGGRRVRGWDTASTEGGGDYTAGVKMSIFQKRYYVEHVFRDQIGPAAVNAMMKSFAQTDGVGCAQREEKEGGSAGKAVVTARAQELPGTDYGFTLASADKVTKAKAFRAQVEAGNVFIVRTGDPNQDAWIEPYLAELSIFPVGKHDDQVDGSSIAFNSLVAEKPKVISGTWGSR